MALPAAVGAGGHVANESIAHIATGERHRAIRIDEDEGDRHAVDDAGPGPLRRHGVPVRRVGLGHHRLNGPAAPLCLSGEDLYPVGHTKSKAPATAGAG